jgi:hypothetical protein
MTPHVPEKFSTRLIDRKPVVIKAMSPRDPDEDEDENEDEEKEEEEEERSDEAPVVREPDDD